jgi:hypothetical protein
MEGPCGMPQGYVGWTCHKRVKYEENEVTPDRYSDKIAISNSP